MKYLNKNPSRPLPFPGFTTNLPPPMEEPKPIPQEPLSYMMLPTLEEFGVRRPFDSVGPPSALGGQGQWPMMSRTMNHVSLFSDPFVEQVGSKRGIDGEL